MEDIINPFLKKYGDQYFVFFPVVQLVSGLKSGMLYHLKDGKAYPISNEIVSVFNENKKNRENIRDLISRSTNPEELINFLEYFLRHSFGVIVKDRSNFPDLNLEVKKFSLIENAIIEIDNFSKEELKLIIYKLEEVQCHAAELVFLHKKPEYILNTLELFHNSSIQTLVVNLLCEENVTDNFAFKICSNFIKVQFLKFAGLEHKIFDYKGCFIVEYPLNKPFEINPNSFVYNLSSYIEAQNYSLGLNRKIFINKNGEIKNSPLFMKSFGNIFSTDLKLLVNSDFNKFWNISKKSVAVCCHCEHRFACIDLDELIQITDGKFQKKNECSIYNLSSIDEHVGV